MHHNFIRSCENTTLFIPSLHITTEGYIYRAYEAILRILLRAYNLAELNTMNQIN